MSELFVLLAIALGGWMIYRYATRNLPPFVDDTYPEKTPPSIPESNMAGLSPLSPPKKQSINDKPSLKFGSEPRRSTMMPPAPTPVVKKTESKSDSSSDFFTGAIVGGIIGSMSSSPSRSSSRSDDDSGSSWSSGSSSSSSSDSYSGGGGSSDGGGSSGDY